MLAGTAVVRRGDATPPSRPLRIIDLRDRDATELENSMDDESED
jgi:hypothetical protein